MKIQHTAVIFILIAIPILLVVSYYMGLQIDTITLQTTYNTKLLSSTKAGLEAFEINSVQWNNQYSDSANTRRRNVEASINTFINSLANNLGISGANKEYLEAYLPAVMMNLYEGYYIYTPVEMKKTAKDDNGVDDFDDNENLIYETTNGSETLDPKEAATETKQALLPLVPYSEENKGITINYTLDNYVKIYGNFDCDEDYANYGGDKTKKLRDYSAEGFTYERRNEGVAYVKEEGYLIYNKNYSFDFDAMKNVILLDLKYNDELIKPETLTENVTYKEKDNYYTKPFKYIFIEDSQGDKTKLYYCDNDHIPEGVTNNWFTVDSKYERVFLSDNFQDVTQYVYKKVSLPSQEYDNDKLNRYINFYQVLNGPADEKEYWYADWNDDGELVPSEKLGKDSSSEYVRKYYLNEINENQDCSAIKYYVQGYYFTRWVNNVVAGKFDNSKDDMGFTCKGVFTINENNDPGNPKKAEDSAFYQHKNWVIQNQIMDSLAQAIYTYEGSSGELPNLTGPEWEQILSNVSMVSFMQGMPIGLKKYNSYAIATSTNNKEYVDPNELYFINGLDENGNLDQYYHQCYCRETTASENYQGYRAIDFINKNYKTDSDETNYYYLHNSGDNGNISSMSCYYCLVNRANYTKIAGDENNVRATAYDTALARERYRANQDVVLAKEYAKFTIVEKTITNANTKGFFEIGEDIVWSIKIKNIGDGTGSINVYDNMPNGLEYSTEDISINGSFSTHNIEKSKINNSFSGYIYNIEKDKEVEIIVKTKVTDSINFGTNRNIVSIRNTQDDTIVIESKEFDANFEQTINFEGIHAGEGHNIVIVMDASQSMSDDQFRTEKTSVCNFIQTQYGNNYLRKESNSAGNEIAVVQIKRNANEILGYSYNGVNDLKTEIGKMEKASIFEAATYYEGALENAKVALNKMNDRSTGNSNEVIFITDGCPTPENSGIPEFYVYRDIFGNVSFGPEYLIAKNKFENIKSIIDGMNNVEFIGVAIGNTGNKEETLKYLFGNCNTVDESGLTTLLNTLATQKSYIPESVEPGKTSSGKITLTGDVAYIEINDVQININPEWIESGNQLDISKAIQVAKTMGVDTSSKLNITVVYR